MKHIQGTTWDKITALVIVVAGVPLSLWLIQLAATHAVEKAIEYGFNIIARIAGK